LNSQELVRVKGVAPHDTAFPQVAEDLETLSGAHNYHRWLYSSIKGALGTRIVEVGAGIGNYTPLLLKHGRVHAIDPEPAYVSLLRERFSNHESFEAEELALGDWSAETRARLRQFRPDTFVCLNVLEHVEDDASAVAAMFDCLQPGGQIALVLPALRWLYSPLDARYGHYRRYTKPDVARLTSGLPSVSTTKCQFLNAAAVPGWWFNHVLMKRLRLPQAQTLLFDRTLVPLAAAVERVLPVPFGLSLVVWLKKGR
jgi:SAM-dependent methyltransferase